MIFIERDEYSREMNTEQKPLEYEFNSLVFGINSSPFLAQFVSQHHATVHQQQYPRAAEVILKSTYMDDSMDSVIDETEGVELYKECQNYGKKQECRLINGSLIH